LTGPGAATFDLPRETPTDLALELPRSPKRRHSTSNDLAREAKLARGSQAYMKLKREPGADGKGVVLKNVKYFNAAQNDGFRLDRSIEHRADLEGRQFS
jgi:hypothetical protein